MSRSVATRITLPESALAELEMVEQSDWAEGIPLSELIDWINQVVERYHPDDSDSRSSPTFTPRSFRHYQTLGCIDSPARSGKSAVYSFRHYLQGLLVRKLLWERVPSEQITSLMKGKTTDDYKKLLFQGVEIVVREKSETPGSDAISGNSQQWARTTVGKGIELHIREDTTAHSPADLKRILAEVERVLRGR